MTTRPVVLKFGGAALVDVHELFERVEAARRERLPVVLVVSAREGVTDLFLDVLAHPRSVARHRKSLARLEELHPELPGAGWAQLRRTRRLVQEVERRYPRDRPLADRLLSQGERLAVHWVSARLETAGIPAVPVEADHLGLITDNAYGASCILFDRSESVVRSRLLRILRQGSVPVVTGFFGRSLEGRVAVLGRGGSDYSASAIGKIVGAQRVELVKRNVTVLSADPRVVPRARPIARLSYEEAEELAQFGAKVLHPLTIEPARAGNVEVWVRALDDPSAVTRITAGDPTHRARAVTMLAPLRLFRLRVPGGRQRPGVVAEVSSELADARVNLVALFTSAALLSLVLAPEESAAAVRTLRRLAHDSKAVLEGPFHVALLTAIGEEILEDLGRIPASALRRAFGFSATSRAVSLAVPETEARSTLRSLHHALVERRAR